MLHDLISRSTCASPSSKTSSNKSAFKLARVFRGPRRGRSGVGDVGDIRESATLSWGGIRGSINTTRAEALPATNRFGHAVLGAVLRWDDRPDRASRISANSPRPTSSASVCLEHYGVYYAHLMRLRLEDGADEGHGEDEHGVNRVCVLV